VDTDANVDAVNVRLTALLTGRLQALDARGTQSGIHKEERCGPVYLGAEGLAGDEQGDRKRHGGPEKALHHYAYEHYAYWRAWCGPLDVLSRPGAFGENLSTTGLTEDNCCIGDVYALGTAVLQVSQARQPCWKLNQRFGRKDMALQLQRSRLTGWYYRVLQAGFIAAGDQLRLLERPHAAWPLRRLLNSIYGEAERMHLPTLAEIAGLEALSPSWRQLAQKRLECGVLEDWAPRLSGDG
jgi:MOSC domain-containing protein YiiM